MFMLPEFVEKINRGGFTGDLRFDEPMAAHTTFRVGGPADCWIRPDGASFPEYASRLLAETEAAGVPVFILGGGANLVVSDRGIRGIVLDTTAYRGRAGLGGESGGGTLVAFCAGTPVDEMAEEAANLGLSFEFFAGMPGAIGGAMWMNARCYEHSVSDYLAGAKLLSRGGAVKEYRFRSGDFGYKRSPFQKSGDLILEGSFRLPKKEAEAVRGQMERYRSDRESKGHYRCPSAGSAFKNNRAAGRPSGKIIDDLGLRGFGIGGAQIAPWHGNIIINRGNASAGEIKALCSEVRARVKKETGFELECEILFIGDFFS
ncbi:MAG: UDP-N-acetylmuramate dehydrogenase [Treponema sp.]|jgi:UDP-N-acetylmuramate dehydrogenase|nr:UDP-N-acetylmuramate dehydrogenase [Treponema sp.]